MKYDLNILQKYLDDELLEVQSHPTLPLKIYNYSRGCAFEKKWDEITLAMRGTVLDLEGNLIAKGYDKFFNYEELKPTDIPWGDNFVHVQDKADGSLGILFNYKGEWILCTRGSFTSDQAIKGMEILKSKYDLNRFYHEFVYLLEIIYPENQIVINYSGAEKVIFTSCLDKYCNELNWTTTLATLHSIGIDKEDIVEYTTIWNFNDSKFVSELKNRNIQNKEGYVIRFSPSNFRMKIKFQDYVRLHSLMTHFSNVDIWDCLRNDDDINQLLQNVPDEFDSWVRKTVSELRYQFLQISEYAGKMFYHEHDDTYEIFNNDKAKFAEWVKKQERYLQPILFCIWNKKDYSKIIWKYIRPKYQKPFWQSKTNDSE